MHKNCNVIHIEKPTSNKGKKILNCLDQANEHPITLETLLKTLNECTQQAN